MKLDSAKDDAVTAVETHLVAGIVLNLAEPDYLYGLGRLYLRLAAPLDRRRLATLEWVRIIGDEIRWDGEVTPNRDVNVRVSAIMAAIQPVGWLPTSAHEYQAGRKTKPLPIRSAFSTDVA